MDGMIIKQVVLILILSVLSVLFQDQLAHLLVFLLHLHNALADLIGRLTHHFGSAGVLIRDSLALVLIPFAAGLIASGFYWLVKHTQMPNMMMVVWCVWTVMLISIWAQGSRV